jgi:hypothetical protein
MDIFTIQIGFIGGYKTKASPPVPPTPVIVSIEPRRWPGPSWLLYSEDMYYKRQHREEDEIVIL